MAIVESNKARKRRLDQGFNLRFAPSDNERIWNEEICVENIDFWDKIGLSRQQRETVAPSSKSQLLQTACDEIDRSFIVDQLKVNLIKSCKSKYPSMGYERWSMSSHEHILSNNQGNKCYHGYEMDPLIPCFQGVKPTYVDKSLVKDLTNAGLSQENAQDIATKLSLCSTKACQDMNFAKQKNRQNQYHKSTWIISKSSSTSLNKNQIILSLKHNRLSPNKLIEVCLASEVLQKLRILYHRHTRLDEKTEQNNPKEKEDMFHASVFRMISRYETLGAPGYQASLPGSTFEVLRRCFGVEMECFASPLNSYYERYCSAFPDTDACFGSIGSFFEFCPKRGSFEVNPPFSPAIMLRAYHYIERLLRKSQKKILKQSQKHNESQEEVSKNIDRTQKEEDEEEKTHQSKKQKKKHKKAEEDQKAMTQKSINNAKYALTFVMIIPVWEDSEVWKLVNNSSYLKGIVKVRKEDQAWRESAPSITAKMNGKAARRVPCDTALFVLQNDQGAQQWKCNDTVLKQIESSLTLK